MRLAAALPGMLLLALPGSAAGAPAPPAGPTLFQLAARAELVVHARVRAGALKHALVEVLAPLKGEPPAGLLRIAFRDANLDRPPGTAAMVFTDGREEILFLRPYPLPPKRRAKNPDLFELIHGARGRLTLPAEGGRGFVDAVREITGIVADDPAAQIRRLAALLSSANPFLAEASLLEIERLDAASEAHYSHLVALLGSPRSALRAGALRLMARVFAAAGERPEGARAGDPYDPADPAGAARSALAGVAERARNDSDVEVRVAAVAALGAWPIPNATNPDLRAIAASDRSQDVRFEAKRILFLRGISDSVK